jgi:hypothetical protein
MSKEIQREVVVFHQFLQDWISGRVQESGALFRSELADHFDKSFEFVMPDGTHLRKRDLVGALKSAWGTDPTFRVKVKIRSVRAVGNGVFLVVYEEHQIEEGKKNRRLSLAVLVKRTGSKKVTWLHCHESPLPSS